MCANLSISFFFISLIIIIYKRFEQWGRRAVSTIVFVVNTFESIRTLGDKSSREFKKKIVGHRSQIL